VAGIRKKGAEALGRGTSTAAPTRKQQQQGRPQQRLKRRQEVDDEDDYRMSLEESSEEEEWEEWEEEEEEVRVGRPSSDGDAASGGGEAGSVGRDIVYRGVRRHTTGRWLVRVTRNGMRMTVGDNYKTAEAAARAYDVEQRKASGMHTLMCNFLLDGSLNPMRNVHYKTYVFGWAGCL